VFVEVVLVLPWFSWLENYLSTHSTQMSHRKDSGLEFAVEGFFSESNW
jgi:hypothetical protein